MAERLQKLLSRWGIASRRQAEKLIQSGRVTVNGEIATLGQQADVDTDQICVDGETIGSPPDSVTLLLNKPRGVVTTCRDPQGRRTVLSLLDRAYQQGAGLHPVGRLDIDSTGALLLTNDGQLTYQLTHPRHHLSKVYRVQVTGTPTKAALRQWRTGVMLDGQMTLPARVEWKRSLEGDRTELFVTLTEGRNRQIRRVASQLGYPVTALHRTKIGSLSLGHLSVGRYRLVTEREIQRLKADSALPVADVSQ